MSFQINWDTHENLVICDIHAKKYERIFQYLLENFFRTQKLFIGLGLLQMEHIEDDYRAVVMHVLRGECSVMAIDEQTNEIHAVALLKCMTTEMRSWTALRLVGKIAILKELIEMRRQLVLQNSCEESDPYFDSLHLFHYFINEHIRYDFDFVYKFFNAMCEVARHMKMPRVTYVAFTNTEQDHADCVGWMEVARLIYSIYPTKHRRAFAMLRNFNENHAVLFEQPVEPLLPFYLMKVSQELEGDETRDELLHQYVSTISKVSQASERMSKISRASPAPSRASLRK